jgi:LysR family nitrogen assimilation transcriptional regulator
LNDFLANARSIAAGSVQLATQPSIGWPLVSHLLDVLARDYPNIRIQISEGTTNNIEEWLSDGRCELAVVSRAASPRYAESTRLFSLPMYLVALPLNVVQEVNSFYLIKRIVRKGPIYTITTYTSVEEELQKGELAGVPIVQPTINQTFYLSVASRRMPTNTVKTVKSLILDWAKGMRR